MSLHTHTSRAWDSTHFDFQWHQGEPERVAGGVSGVKYVDYSNPKLIHIHEEGGKYRACCSFLLAITELALGVKMTPTPLSPRRRKCFQIQPLIGLFTHTDSKDVAVTGCFLLQMKHRALCHLLSKRLQRLPVAPRGKVVKSWTSWKLPSDAMQVTKNTGVSKSWSSMFLYLEGRVRRGEGWGWKYRPAIQVCLTFSNAIVVLQ